MAIADAVNFTDSVATVSQRVTEKETTGVTEFTCRPTYSEIADTHAIVYSNADTRSFTTSKTASGCINCRQIAWATDGQMASAEPSGTSYANSGQSDDESCVCESSSRQQAATFAVSGTKSRDAGEAGHPETEGHEESGKELGVATKQA